MATVTAREFNHDVSGAKRLADREPVIITDRGAPAYALITIATYRQLTGQKRNILNALRIEGSDDIDFDTEPVQIELQAADL
ncbi:type II toxin-antitoxin system prevent-host-death family antitoxin [Rathayibacter sp. YIM 133350]|uniref:type II toxin-antitoxin system prevent-host-death family antitoxin n=1 Tax=Rathayibacter sp. YIM 133350 TaxID=3131992 RepID=UPI00307FC7B3